MQFGKGVSVVLTLAVLVCGASGALAQEWKPGKQCDQHGDGLRCNFNSEMRGQSARVVIQNLKPAAVTIDWHEFHSACGWPGGVVQSDNDLTIPGSTTVPHRLLDPGTGITCREVYISCRYAGSGTRCSDVIRATMESFIGNQQ